MVTKELCQHCRQSKQKCTPAQRNWVEGGEKQICDRCLRYNHQCGPSERLPPRRSRRRRSPPQQQHPRQSRATPNLPGLLQPEHEEASVADLVDLARDHIGVGGAEQELRRRLADLDVQVEALKNIQLAMEYLETNDRQGEPHYGEMYSLKNAGTRELSSKLGLAESLTDRIYEAGEIGAAERAYTRILSVYRMMDIKAWYEVHSLLVKMANIFWKFGEPFRAEKLLWEALELGEIPRQAREADFKVLKSLATSLSRTSKDLSRLVQDMVIGPISSKLTMFLPPLQRMMESKYASDVMGNVFQTGPLTDAEGVFPPILGGVEAIREVIEMVPQADLQATDLHGRSPLFMATDLQKEHFGLALLLHAAEHPSIPRRQFTNARDKYGQTTLGIAILRRCSLEYIAALIDYGAEVDPETLMEFVLTPLQIASCLGYSDIVDLLLEHDAQPGRIWPGTKTPEALAREAGHNHIVDKLQSHVAG